MRKEFGGAAAFSRASAVKAATLRRYIEALGFFRRWALAHGRSWHTHLFRDQATNGYLEHLYAEYPVAVGRIVAYASQLLERDCCANDYLPAAKMALRGWAKRCFSRMRLPVPEEIILWLALHALYAFNGPFLSAAIVLQLDGTFRPLDILEMHAAQVCPPVPAAGAAYAKDCVFVVAPFDGMKTTKTGQQDDSIIMGDRRARVEPILYELHRLRHDDKWFSIALSRYENFFRRESLTLGLQALQLCPHVVRQSSASNDRFHKRRTLKEIKKRGRWAVDMFVARYLRTRKKACCSRPSSV